MILPDIVWLASNSIGRAALDATITPGTMQPWVSELQEYTQANGKFSRFAVAYLPFPLPPLAWDYKCFKCRFWAGPRIEPSSPTRERLEAVEGACQLVKGTIVPVGVCVLWMPPEGYGAFSWPKELAAGKW